MDHLTDNELIDYIIKFDTDPIRVRLASVMDNMPGAIIDSLEEAGMDPVFCTFENTYLPGEYIRHLENEIEFLNNELYEAQDKIKRFEARTVAELINELKAYTDLADTNVRRAERAQREAEKERDHAKSKLSMWAKLNGDFNT